MVGRKKKKWVWILAVLVIVAVLAVVSRLTNHFFGNALHTVFSPVQSLAGKTAGAVQEFFVYAGNMKNFQQENEDLKIENAKLKKENRSVEDYKKENERLRKLLGIQEELKTCETQAARVIGYEPNNWYDTIVINKGSNADIEKQDVVISDSGIVGQISDVGANWARISTLIDADHAVGVRITRTGDIGVAEGDPELMQENKCKLDYIGSNVSVVAGDILETSGIGGLYPPGLTVGKVSDVKIDSTGRLTAAAVEPATNLETLHEVLVITHWEMEEQKPAATQTPAADADDEEE